MGTSSTIDAPDTDRRPSRRGTEARQSLVAAAERLFAEHGIAGVSLRDVSAAAGQRNHSAAQYHFGDREGLVAAVYEAHMHRVERRRLEILAELSAAGQLDEVPALLSAAVLPLVDEVTSSEGWYARFLLRTRWDPVATQVVAELHATTGLHEIAVQLGAAVQHLPAPIRRSRLDQVFSLVVSTLAAWEWSHDRAEPRLPVPELVAELTATGAAVLLAPTSSA